MMSSAINKEVFELSFSSEELAGAFLRRMENGITGMINARISKMLDDVEDADVLNVIDKIEIDLGTWTADDFEKGEMLPGLDEQLQKYLIRIPDAGFVGDAPMIQTKEKDANGYLPELALLKGILLENRLPWWADEKRAVSVPEIISRLARNNRGGLSNWLKSLHEKELQTVLARVRRSPGARRIIDDVLKENGLSNGNDYLHVNTRAGISLLDSIPGNGVDLMLKSVDRQSRSQLLTEQELLRLLSTLPRKLRNLLEPLIAILAGADPGNLGHQKRHLEQLTGSSKKVMQRLFLEDILQQVRAGLIDASKSNQKSWQNTFIPELNAFIAELGKGGMEELKGQENGSVLQHEVKENRTVQLPGKNEDGGAQMPVGKDNDRVQAPVEKGDHQSINKGIVHELKERKYPSEELSRMKNETFPTAVQGHVVTGNPFSAPEMHTSLIQEGYPDKSVAKTQTAVILMRRISELSEEQGIKVEKSRISKFVSSASPEIIGLLSKYLYIIPPENLKPFLRKIGQSTAHPLIRKRQIRKLAIHPFLLRYQLLQLYPEMVYAIRERALKEMPSGSTPSALPQPQREEKPLSFRKKLARKSAETFANKLLADLELYLATLEKLRVRDRIIFKDILEKGTADHPGEKHVLVRVLKRLPDTAIYLLNELTDLPESIIATLQTTLKELSYSEERADAQIAPDRNGDLKIGNAGLCLVAAYLPPLFESLDYLENKKFKDKATATRAAVLLQYVASGSKQQKDFLMSFNKILCGLDIKDAIPARLKLTQKETEAADELLAAIITNWSVLKNTSLMGLRETFIRRNGIIKENINGWTLHIEKLGADVLLNMLPWSYNLIRLPWMKKMITVEW